MICAVQNSSQRSELSLVTIFLNQPPCTGTACKVSYLPKNMCFGAAPLFRNQGRKIKDLRGILKRGWQARGGSASREPHTPRHFAAKGLPKLSG